MTMLVCPEVARKSLAQSRTVLQRHAGKAKGLAVHFELLGTKPQAPRNLDPHAVAQQRRAYRRKRRDITAQLIIAAISMASDTEVDCAERRMS